MAEIPPLIIPVIPLAPVPPPTRGMVIPPTRGLTPPTALIPDLNVPTLNLPPTTFDNPDPGTPSGGPSQSQEQGEVEELPMRPFDASTNFDFNVPVIGIPVSVPVPRAAVIVTAGTTAMTAAVAATGAAILSKPLFDWLMKKLKPLAKKIAKKLLQKKDVVYP